MRRFQLLRFGLALLLQIGFCAALNLFDDWTLQEMPARFVAAGIACGIAFMFAVAQFPDWISLRKQALLFWSVAILLRAIALPLAVGDDFWRYQWEGKMQHGGFNPYLQAPDDPALAQLREDFPFWYKINHRDYRAIYPPGAELLFAALSPLTDRPLVFKLLFTATDLGTAALLLFLLPKARRYADAAWYAWNPLVVYSFAGGAHFDSLMVLPMVAAILCLVRHDTARNSRAKWLYALGAAALLGSAISIKLIPLLLLPLCVFALGFRAITLAVSLAIPALLSMVYGWPRLPIWDSLGRFAYVTRLNDLFWWLIEETVWPNPRQKNYHYNVVVIVAVVLVSLLFYRNWRRGMLWVLGTALILTPVLHPWYCTWILPLATWRRVPPWQVLSVTLFTYFLFWNERLFLLPWHAELWMRAILIVPPFVAAVLFFWREHESPPVTAASPAPP